MLDFYAKQKTKLYKKDFEKAHKLATISAIYSHLLFTGKADAPKIYHPLHSQRLYKYITVDSQALRGKTNATINFGDSLTDLARPAMLEIDGIYSISGSWSNHIADMARDMRPALQPYINNIKYITVGTLGGNPLLVYESYASVITEAIKALNEIRALYPNQKIIVYTLPPTYNIWATTHVYQFTVDIFAWAQRDKNACVIDMHKAMGDGFMNLLPTTQWSADGVHFTPSGARKFIKLVEKAKTTKELLVC